MIAKYICYVKYLLCDLKNGGAVVCGFADSIEPDWLKKQGVVAGAKINILQNNRHYVLFEMDNSKCAIDKKTASQIEVERVYD